MGKTVNVSFEGKLVNGQNIDYSENKWPKGFICPCTYHNIQTCLLVYVADLRTIGRLVFINLLQVQAEYSKIDQLGYDVNIEIKRIEFWETDPVSKSSYT